MIGCSAGIMVRIYIEGTGIETGCSAGVMVRIYIEGDRYSDWM